MPTGAILGIGAGLSALGSGLNASSQGSTKWVKNPAPTALFPNIQQQFLAGLTGSGGAGPTGMNTLTSMEATGNPTDVGPAWDAQVAAMQPMLNQQRSQILTQFGQEGLRYSSPAINAVGNFESNTTAQMFSTLAQWRQQAQEAAANRQLQASEFGTNLYSQPAEAMYPTATLVGGGPSVAGSVMGSAGNSMMQFMLMKELGLFGGGSNYSQTYGF